MQTNLEHKKTRSLSQTHENLESDAPKGPQIDPYEAKTLLVSLAKSFMHNEFAENHSADQYSHAPLLCCRFFACLWRSTLLLQY